MDRAEFPMAGGWAALRAPGLSAEPGRGLLTGFVVIENGRTVATAGSL